MSNHELFLWKRPEKSGSTFRFAFLAYLLTLPFWVEALRFGIMSVKLARADSFVLLGIFPLLLANFEGGVWVILFGSLAVVSGLVWVVYLYFFGLANFLGLEEYGIVLRYDGRLKKEVHIKWQEFTGLIAENGVPGVSLYAKRKKKARILLAVVQYAGNPKGIVADIETAYTSWLQKNEKQGSVE